MCDGHLGPTRRDVLRVGGAGMLGLSLGSMLQLKAQAATSGGHTGGPGWGKGEERHPSVFARRTKSSRPMGSQGECS